MRDREYKEGEKTKLRQLDKGKGRWKLTVREWKEVRIAVIRYYQNLFEEISKEQTRKSII